jgi:hypothetical protein
VVLAIIGVKLLRKDKIYLGYLLIVLASELKIYNLAFLAMAFALPNHKTWPTIFKIVFCIAVFVLSQFSLGTDVFMEWLVALSRVSTYFDIQNISIQSWMAGPFEKLGKANSQYIALLSLIPFAAGATVLFIIYKRNRALVGSGVTLMIDPLFLLSVLLMICTIYPGQSLPYKQPFALLSFVYFAQFYLKSGLFIRGKQKNAVLFILFILVYTSISPRLVASLVTNFIPSLKSAFFFVHHYGLWLSIAFLAMVYVYWKEWRMQKGISI